MKMEGIELYPHNQKAYDNLCAMLRDSNRACVVQPTGTGKFVIIAKMAHSRTKWRAAMSDAKRTKNYIVHKLRKNYREGKLDTSQVARLKAIGFNFDGAVFNASKDSLAVQYPAIAEEWDKERNGEQTPWKVRPLATKKAWWRCPHCDRPYRLAIRSKVISNSGCPDTGINYNSIGSVARGNRHKAGGYTWEYVNPAPDKRDNRGCNQPTAKKVRCAETGNQFVSLSDAARAVGLRNGNSIRRAIDRGGTAGGYHWEYLDEKKEVSTDDHHQADGRAE